MDVKKIEEKVRELNGFNSFNPMQKKALKKDIYSKNLVLSAPTASGKTIIAMLCALNCIINKKKKVIYTCPLKAIASEHYKEFKKRYSKPFNVRVAISTGDFDSSSKYLSKYDLIFCTNEKIDSLIRHQAEWLKSVGLLVVDEIHELDSGRGATLEMVIAKMCFVLPSLQVLALSATIPNAKEIAEWLSAELVESNFRPVELKEGILLEKTIYFPKKKEEQELSYDEEELQALIEDTLEKKKQALFFLNTRRNAEGFAKKATKIVWNKLLPKEKDYLQRLASRIESVLETPTEQCKTLASLVRKGVAFHHAGLLSKQRELVEDAFREGKLKVISATPTLAAGVNLPSFRVVIPSLYRYTVHGMQRIPVREYKQMCLPFNAKIITKEMGELEIGKIVENKLKCNVLSFNEELERLEFKPIMGFFKNNQNSIIVLKTKLGNELRLTPNHPVLIKEEDKFGWKKSKDVRVGDKIIHRKYINRNFQKPPYFINLLPKDNVYDKEGKEFELIEITGKSNSVYDAPVYNLAIKDNNNYFANNVLVHNCGRAGRPRYDSSGESIIVARSEPELEELKECYVEGELEGIESRLAFEPVLRMHLLALIATRFVFDSDSMKAFFQRTFYSLQYGEIEGIIEKLKTIAEELKEFGFVVEKNGRLFATMLGRRVSDLYLDPLSAKNLIEALKKKLDIFSALFAFVNTFEFSPWISINKKRESELWECLLSMQSSLPIDVSSEQFFDSALLEKFNSTLLLKEWIEEKSEQQLMEEFNTRPGILFSKLLICDWLAYSAIELSKLLKQRENIPVLLEVRKRLKYGVKKELLPLVELKGIGRVRARRLFRAGIRSIAQLKKASFQDLSKIVGERIALNIKKQLGQRIEIPKNSAKTKKTRQSLPPYFK